MNICLMYNKEAKEAVNFVNNLKNYDGKLKDKYSIKFLERVTSRTSVDIYLIISNEIEEIIQYDVKIKDKERIVIVTGNCDTTHILSCIEITNTVSHIDSAVERVLERVILKKYENKV